MAELPKEIFFGMLGFFVFKEEKMLKASGIRETVAALVFFGY